MYCAGVLTFDGGFMDWSSFRRTSATLRRSWRRRGRAVRPASHRDEQHGRFERASIRAENRRSFEPGAPNRGLAGLDKEHHVRKPRSGGGVAHITLLREHEGKRARVGRAELAACKRGSGLVDQLLPVGAGQHPFSAFQVLRQHAPHSGRIEAVRRAQYGIPELRIVETSGPGPLDEAHVAVRPLTAVS